MTIKKEWPTAKERMNAGEWVHRRFYQSGMSGIHYYVEKLPMGKYRISYTHTFSYLGMPVMSAVKLLSLAGKFVFNLINKGAGDQVFSEVIEEIDELSLARKHRQSTGKAYTLDNRHESLGECDEAIRKHIEKLEAE